MLRCVRSWLAILVTLGCGCTDHGAGDLTAIKDQVCACTTAACAEQAMAQVPKKTIASNHRTQTIARAMLDCAAKLEAADRPSTDPDDEGEPAPVKTGPGAAAPAATTPPGTAPTTTTPKTDSPAATPPNAAPPGR
jgi:hypothetical protein